MPAVIVATPKAVNANSYLTLVRANAIMDERLYVTAWTAATDDTKNRALIWSTALLDAMMEWQGNVTEPGTWNGTEQVGIQALRWPRYPVVNRDGYGYLNKDTIPLDIERATVELALSLLGSDRFAMPSILGQGIEEASVGSLRVKVSAAMVEDLIPANIYAMLAHLGNPIPEAQLGGTRRNKVKRV